MRPARRGPRPPTAARSSASAWQSPALQGEESARDDADHPAGAPAGWRRRPRYPPVRPSRAVSRATSRLSGGAEAEIERGGRHHHGGEEPDEPVGLGAEQAQVEQNGEEERRGSSARPPPRWPRCCARRWSRAFRPTSTRPSAIACGGLDDALAGPRRSRRRAQAVQMSGRTCGRPERRAGRGGDRRDTPADQVHDATVADLGALQRGTGVHQRDREDEQAAAGGARGAPRRRPGGHRGRARRPRCWSPGRRRRRRWVSLCTSWHCTPRWKSPGATPSQSSETVTRANWRRRYRQRAPRDDSARTRRRSGRGEAAQHAPIARWRNVERHRRAPRPADPGCSRSTGKPQRLQVGKLRMSPGADQSRVAARAPGKLRPLARYSACCATISSARFHGSSWRDVGHLAQQILEAAGSAAHARHQAALLVRAAVHGEVEQCWCRRRRRSAARSALGRRAVGGQPPALPAQRPQSSHELRREARHLCLEPGVARARPVRPRPSRRRARCATAGARAGRRRCWKNTRSEPPWTGCGSTSKTSRPAPARPARRPPQASSRRRARGRPCIERPCAPASRRDTGTRRSPPPPGPGRPRRRRRSH